MKTIKQILNISEPLGPGMGRFALWQCRLGLTGQETLPFTSTPCEQPDRRPCPSSAPPVSDRSGDPALHQHPL